MDLKQQNGWMSLWTKSFFIWESWITILFVPSEPHLWTIQLCKPGYTDFNSYRSALCTWLEVQLARNLNSGVSYLAQSFSWGSSGDRHIVGQGFSHSTPGHITLRFLPAPWGAVLTCFWLKSRNDCNEGQQSNIYPMVWQLKSFFLAVGDVSPNCHRQRIRCTWIS